MVIKAYLLSMLMGWSFYLQTSNFSQLAGLAPELSKNLDQICISLVNPPENLSTYELYLQALFNWPYASILRQSFLPKHRVIEQFKAKYCQKLLARSFKSSSPASDLGQNSENIKVTRHLIETLNSTTGFYDNIVFVEYFLHALGFLSRDLLNINYAEKRLLLSNLLSFVFDPVTTISSLTSNLSSSPVVSSIPASNATLAHGGAGSEEENLSSAFNILKTNCVQGGTISYLGGYHSFCLVSNLFCNRVTLSSYPIVGKYLGDTGYPMASMNVVIDNNMVDSALLNHVPANILNVIPGGYHTDFYTEILNWNPVETDPVGTIFSGKNQQFNLVLHGTMMDWFADKYSSFNFATQSISENLNLGIFNFDGISKVDQLGNSRLVSQSVNPHNDHLSPDNARFTVQHGRNLITWWSVATSDVKRRAIITYHVLINQEAYPDLVANIERVTKESSQLPDLIAGLSSIPSVGGMDGEIWSQALEYLRKLYAVTLPITTKGAPTAFGYYGTKRRNGGITLSDDFFCATVGKFLVDSRSCGSLNRVGQHEWPGLNKYNEGRPAIPMVLLENDYHLFKKFVPQDIKDALVGIDDDNISFYVSISSGKGFYDKGRRYNLIFHGTMAEWYDAEMTAAGFDFASGGFVRDLPMGIFDFDGLELGGGDIAKNRLSIQNVNAHDRKYSPDNAGFIVQDGRHVVTFWSVARSDDKRRAVITFHILFDEGLPNNFRQKVSDFSQHDISLTNLGELLNGLQDLSANLTAGSEDQATWNEAIMGLKKMYS